MKAFSDARLIHRRRKRRQVLDRLDYSLGLFGDQWIMKALKALLIPPGPLMSTGAAK
jgi:hypothetical protein